MKKEMKQFIAGLLGAATVFTTSACASEVKDKLKVKWNMLKTLIEQMIITI